MKRAWFPLLIVGLATPVLAQRTVPRAMRPMRPTVPQSKYVPAPSWNDLAKVAFECFSCARSAWSARSGPSTFALDCYDCGGAVGRATYPYVQNTPIPRAIACSPLSPYRSDPVCMPTNSTRVGSAPGNPSRYRSDAVWRRR